MKKTEQSPRRAKRSGAPERTTKRKTSLNGASRSKRPGKVVSRAERPAAKAKRTATKAKAVAKTKAKRTVAKTKRTVAKPKAKRTVAKTKRTVAKTKRTVAKPKAKRTVAKAKRTVAKAKRPVAKTKRTAAKTKTKRAVTKPKTKRTVAKTKTKRAVTKPKAKRTVAKTNAKRAIAKPKRALAGTTRPAAKRPIAPPREAPALVVAETRSAQRPLVAVAQTEAPLATGEPVSPTVVEVAAPASPVGVRVGRLPPRGEGATLAPPELSRPASTLQAKSPLSMAPMLPRSPFEHGTWKRVEAAHRSLDLGELGSDERRVIRALLEGQDAVVSMPGGLARSASYVVAAQLLPQPVLVVGARPLLLRELFDRLLQRRVATVLVHAGLAGQQRRDALERIAKGGSLVVLTTPQMLHEDDLPQALAASGLSLAVIEDANVMAETSDEQSPAAHGLGLALTRLGSPPSLALLGAATPATQHEVVDRLSLRSPLTLVGSPIRDNVALDVVEARGEVRQRALVQLVLRLRRPGIIFAPTARDVDAIFGALTALRLPVHRYHPHLPPGERVGEQLNFVLPGRRAIMVATSALFSPSGVVGVGEARELDRAPLDFGLGLEKRDLRFMIHWSTPASLEQYSRELALLGRDGEPSTAVMFHDQSDRSRNEMLLAQMRLGARHLTQLVKTLEPAAIDGHPRTLEALALASGLSRKTSEALAAILDDAGLVQYSAGWVRPLLPARALTERGHDLTARLERLRAQDSRRLAEMSAFLEAKSCLRQSLESYFGETRGKCGQCSSCRGSLLPTASTSDAQDRAGSRRPPVETFSVGRGQSYGLEVLPPARQARPLTVKLADFQRGR